jgi:hypothetical protein
VIRPPSTAGPQRAPAQEAAAGGAESRVEGDPGQAQDGAAGMFLQRAPERLSVLLSTAHDRSSGRSAPQ